MRSSLQGKFALSPLFDIPIEIDRIFNDLLCDRDRCRQGICTAPVDMYESDDAVTVTMEVPGLSADDIEVTVDDGMLVIRGEKKQINESTHGSSYRTERRYGRFERRFRLGRDIDTDNIRAKLDRGVLMLTLPKSEATKPKRITVKD